MSKIKKKQKAKVSISNKKEKKRSKKVKQKTIKKYVRTVKRYSLEINLLKWLKLLELLGSQTREKDYFLCQYSGIKNIYKSYNFYDVRNKLVRNKYKNANGLQARQWKLSLKDSLETLNRYWASMGAKWKEKIYKTRGLSKSEKYYLVKAVSSCQGMYNIVRNGFKVSFPKIEITLQERTRCQRFLKKLIKKEIKSMPRVKQIRSYLAEPETYRIFEHKGRQYIALMSKKPRERIVIPLSGKAKISGQIRIVFDFQKCRLEIHHFVKSEIKKQIPQGKTIGIDLGITEVFTDSDGDRWGTNFGKTISKYSDKQRDKGKKRNKLYALTEKYKEKGKRNKVKKIENYNLGKKKEKIKNTKQRVELTRQVNESIKQCLNEKDPKKVIYEDLRHMRGKAKSKRMSRLVSAWIRKIIRERMEFKIVSQGGSLLEAVNCSHSSRVCPICGWVARNNRNGDKFKCQFCGHTAESDYTAAMEILRREKDCEIRLWTHRSQVHKILLQRFRRRLENCEIPVPFAQVFWEPIRKVFSNTFVESILTKLNKNN